LKNAVLHHRRGEPDAHANATLRLTHEFFLRMVTGGAGLRDIVFSDDLSVDGSRLDLLSLLSLLEKSDGRFAIVTP
jgi:alkyl sulfatase BDS1-like metallo-beta-lactamase superfamily hydrolase